MDTGYYINIQNKTEFSSPKIMAARARVLIPSYIIFYHRSLILNDLFI